MILVLLMTTMLTSCSAAGGDGHQGATLKSFLGDCFLIGTALNTAQIIGRDTTALRIVRTHFNSVVAENCMKCEVIHPEENHYDFTLADRFVEFGEKNGMAVIGHCLIWHSQLAPWFCVDHTGNNVCLLYTSPSPRDRQKSRMPSSA